jgi:hypothetical protein
MNRSFLSIAAVAMSLTASFRFFAMIMLAGVMFALPGCGDDDPATLESIAVTTPPAKTAYTTDETFDPAGMVVTATYSDQTTEAVAVAVDMFTYDFSTPDANKTVTVTYNGKTATLTVSVVKSLTLIEEEKYEEFVTPELEDALVNKLGITIHRGPNPPDITGYYRTARKCTQSTIPNDTYLGKAFADYKLNFYGKEDLEISMEGFQVNIGTNEASSYDLGEGCFISGTGNRFTVFFNRTSQHDDGGPNSVTLVVFSGELVKNSQGKITGIKDYQQVVVMRDNGGRTDLLNNGEGRLYTNSLASVITQAQFETSRGSMSVKNAGSGTGVSPGSVSDSHSTVSQ